MSITGIFSPKDINELTAYSQWSGLAGQLELIQTQTVSAVNAINFFDIKEDEYNVHFLTINNCFSTSSNESIGLRFFEDGLIRISNAYQYVYQNGFATGSFSTTASTGGQRAFVTRFNDNGDEKNAYVYFYNLGNASKYSFFTMQSVADHSGFEFRYGQGAMPRLTNVNGINLFGTVGGNISGDFSLYGIRDLDE